MQFGQYHIAMFADFQPRPHGGQYLFHVWPSDGVGMSHVGPTESDQSRSYYSHRGSHMPNPEEQHSPVVGKRRGLTPLAHPGMKHRVVFKDHYGSGIVLDGIFYHVTVG